MQSWESNSGKTFDLDGDIVQELQLMAEIDGTTLPVLISPFDPVAFQETDSNPKIEKYKLSREELQHQCLESLQQ